MNPIDIQNFVIRRREELGNYIRATYKWLDPSTFENLESFLGRVLFTTLRDFTADMGVYELYNDEMSEFRYYMKKTVKQIMVNEYYDEILEYYNKEVGK